MIIVCCHHYNANTISNLVKIFEIILEKWADSDWESCFLTSRSRDRTLHGWFWSTTKTRDSKVKYFFFKEWNKLASFIHSLRQNRHRVIQKLVNAFLRGDFSSHFGSFSSLFIYQTRSINSRLTPEFPNVRLTWENSYILWMKETQQWEKARVS